MWRVVTQSQDRPYQVALKIFEAMDMTKTIEGLAFREEMVLGGEVLVIGWDSSAHSFQFNIIKNNKHKVFYVYEESGWKSKVLRRKDMLDVLTDLEEKINRRKRREELVIDSL